MAVFIKVESQVTKPEGFIIVTYNDGTEMVFENEQSYLEWSSEQELMSAFELNKYRIASAWDIRHHDNNLIKFDLSMDNSEIVAVI